jgi:hypothetical protein
MKLFFKLMIFSSGILFFCDMGTAQGGAAEAAGSIQKRLVVHDFDGANLDNNIGGASGTWNLEETDILSSADCFLDSSQRIGDLGSSVCLTYKLNPKRAGQNGFWTNLNKADLTDYDHIEFWIKGDAKLGFAKSMKVEFKQQIPGSIDEMYKGSYVVNNISDQWQKITIPLNNFSGIREWTKMEELVFSLQTRRADVRQGAYYIDDIALIKTGHRGASAWDPVPAPKKAQLLKELGTEGHNALVKDRLVGWPTITLADKKGFPKDDREFLMRVARDTWKGIDALTDLEHGMPLDTVRLGEKKASLNLKECRVGDYTSTTNVGLYFMSIVGAYDLKFITKAEAIEKIRKTLNTVDKMESCEGFFYNWWETTTLERTSNFISFVDSAWLTAGLMVVRNTFPELEARCSRLIEQGNYKFLYDDVEQLMSHGYHVNINRYAEYQYGSFYTEPRVGSFIAIGKGDVPEEHWFKMTRTFPENYEWQALRPVNRKEKKVRGVEMTGGYYEWKGLQYVPTWGGSLFEALMPTIVIDEKKYAPNSLGRNDEVHAIIHRRYALEELKYPVWGMSPCSVTSKDDYSEYGVKVCGTKGYKPGVITPHVTALAVNFTPKEAVENMRKLIELYDIYGEYGFYDAVDPASGQVAYKYLILDQGMIFISLANYLGDHCVQKRFMADPISQKAARILKDENFFE